MPFAIVRNDIVNMQTDAVVNTANPEPLIGVGVDSRLHQKAGRRLLEARQKIGKIAVGEAAVTRGYRLSAKYVIHTVGPAWQDGSHGEEQLLASCYQNALKLAKQQGCTSVAFPLIATGHYGFPKPLALQIAIRAFSTFLLENEMQIYLVVYDKESFVLSEKLFQSVNSYIDENYISMQVRQQRREHNLFGAVGASRQMGKINRPESSLHMESAMCEDAAVDFEAPVCSAAPATDWSSLLKDLDEGFSVTLLQLIDRTGKKDSEIYKKANVDRKLFSKIRNNPDYKPSKSTALAFAFALELDLQETKDFIARAGFALSRSSKFDVIVEYFLVNGNYDLFELNEVLFAFDQPLIGA